MNDPIHILSLGAGVQSSTMALKAARRLITPMPKAAIFADTQAEPKSVYDWLDWLEKQLPFPVHRVTYGNLWDYELRVRRSKLSGKLYLKNSIPAFVSKEVWVKRCSNCRARWNEKWSRCPHCGRLPADFLEHRKGLLGRKCTSDFKIIPIQREVKRIVGIKRAVKEVRCKMWIGISTEEAHRMKPSRAAYIENIWPLIDLGMSRDDCLKWMKDNGYPEPPRSACVFCPFHSDHEWSRMKKDEPEEFSRAVRFENELRAAAAQQEVLKGIPFLHEKCIPLSEVKFEDDPKTHKQISLFGNECEGLCGV